MTWRRTGCLLPCLEEWNTPYSRHWDRILALKKEKIVGMLPGGQHACFSPWLSANQPEQKVVNKRSLVLYRLPRVVHR